MYKRRGRKEPGMNMIKDKQDDRLRLSGGTTPGRVKCISLCWRFVLMSDYLVKGNIVDRVQSYQTQFASQNSNTTNSIIKGLVSDTADL